MSKPHFDISFLLRTHSARKALDHLYNHLPQQYHYPQLDKRVFVDNLLVDIMDYSTANAGINPPSDKLLIIKHNAYTVTRINKAREAVRGMYALQNRNNNRDASKDRATIQSLLNDFRAHIVRIIKLEAKHG